jgi:hypothetical protein
VRHRGGAPDVVVPGSAACRASGRTAPASSAGECADTLRGDDNGAGELDPIHSGTRSGRQPGNPNPACCVAVLLEGDPDPPVKVQPRTVLLREGLDRAGTALFRSRGRSFPGRHAHLPCVRANPVDRRKCLHVAARGPADRPWRRLERPCLRPTVRCSDEIASCCAREVGRETCACLIAFIIERRRAEQQAPAPAVAMTRHPLSCSRAEVWFSLETS